MPLLAKFPILLPALAWLASLGGCGGGSPAPAGPVGITDLTPQQGPPGTLIALRGWGLGQVQALVVADLDAGATAYGQGALLGAIPALAQVGPQKVQVLTPSGPVAAPVPFLVTPALALAALSPDHGGPGSRVLISGSGLAGVTRVTFAGVAASFEAQGDGLLAARVPPGAPNGPIQVTGPAGVATSPVSFQVQPGAAAGLAIETLAPAQGPPGATVVLSGSGFNLVGAVTLGGIPAPFLWDGAATLSVTVPAGAGPALVQVLAPEASDTFAQPFVITPPVPAIQALSPDHGPGGGRVLIGGSGFLTAGTVTFAGVPASFAVQGDGLLAATVPAGAPGGPVEVITQGGAVFSATPFRVDPPGLARPQTALAITGLAPEAGPAGTTITLTGTGFDQVQAVTLGPFTLPVFTRTGTGALAFQAPALLAAGSWPVQVLGPDGPRASAAPFRLEAPAPAIAYCSPQQGPVGEEVYLELAGFGPGAVATFTGGVRGDLVRSDLDALRVRVPPGAQDGPIRVTSALGAADSPPFQVTSGSPALPVLTSVVPLRGPLGTPLVLAGFGLDKVTDLLLGGARAPFTREGTTTLRATVPLTLALDPQAITVLCPAGPVGFGQPFAVVPPVPAIRAFSPFAARPGASVQIAGTGFLQARSVTFNGVAAAFSVAGDGLIYVRVPPAAGNGPLVVAGPGGTATSTARFQALPASAAPGTAVLAMDPLEGPPGTTVNLAGTGLEGVAALILGTEAMRITSKGEGLATFTLPPWVQAGEAPLKAVLNNGMRLPLAFTFLVTPSPPALSVVSPTLGSAGQPVFLLGQGFPPDATVTFGGIQAEVTSRSADLIVAVVPRNAATGPIRIANAYAGVTSRDDFKIVPRVSGQGEILSLQPSEGPPGVTVNLRGAGFLGVAAVSFGGIQAAFTFLDATWVQAVVPPGAPPGPSTVALTTPAGPCAANDPFRVLAPPTGPPVIASFTPLSGDGSLALTVKGAGLSAVTRATLGPVELLVTPETDATLSARFPPGAALPSGPLRLSSPRGSATSTQAFKAAPRAPKVEGLSPRTGAPGTPVAFAGLDLNEVASVAFGGAPTTDLQERTRTRFIVPVPPGAATGTVTVTSYAGITIPVDGAFTLGTEVPLAYGLAAAYLTQGIQDGTTSLVAGKPAVFRAFALANQANAARPTVRVTLTREGATVFTRELAGPASGVPENLDENALGTYNTLIPGDLVQPGLALLTELLADPALPPEALAQAILPAGGLPQPLPVAAAPPLAITLVPLQYLRNPGAPPETGQVNQGLDAWRAPLLKWFPVAAVDLAIAPPFATGLALTFASDAELIALRDRLEVARLATPGAQYRNWHGVYTLYPGAGRSGMADFGSPGSQYRRTTVGLDGAVSQNLGFAEALAHEVGHSKSRRHAPCGGAAGPDPAYPYPPANLGGAAFDVPAMAPVDNRTSVDLMAYCYPSWISAYTFDALRAFFAADARAAAPAAAPALQDCLAVSGCIQDGVVTLDPALTFQGLPEAPAPGSCLLSCLDAQGRTLLEVPFAPQAEADAPLQSFVFLIPMTPDLKAGLASLRVTSPGGVTERPPTATAALARPPVAVTWTPGTVNVSWDPEAFPLVLVRDPATGAVLANASGGEALVTTGAKELELLLSDGVRTTARRVPVVVQ